MKTKVQRGEKRKKKRSVKIGGNYFTSHKSDLSFIDTGATTLNCIVGGGWVLGRVTNIVGDKSTGKTLLAIEAMVNFAKTYRKGKIRYVEAEAAFQEKYAEALGMPLKRVDLERGIETVEDLFDDINKFISKCGDEVGLYILDSLDALTDEDEAGRDIRKSSYGTGKAKQLSKMFRNMVKRLEESKVSLIIISQIRDNIGVTFGRKYKRSGGKALDFYASQVVYLAHIKELTRTVGGLKRTVGVQIKAKCDKNKIGLPFRSCEFPIIFGYGIEDITAGLDWLKENKCLHTVGLKKSQYADLRKRAFSVKLSDEEFEEWREKIHVAVPKAWASVERSFLPKRSKYT